MSVIGRRLRTARLATGLSQEKLGLDIGLEAESASTRMNRYETGARSPDTDLVERIAAALGVPAPYFYAADDQVAELLCAFDALPKAKRNEILDMVKQVANEARAAAQSKRRASKPT